ncbi:MAG: DUF4097 family beta strand repeat-containing protein [Saprospiraceae bacterium]
MKSIVVKCSLLLLLVPFFAFMLKDSEHVEKKVNREFTIQPNGYVTLTNKYGSLDVAIGEDNQVKINVTISAKASSEKKAQEAVDRISIDFEEGNNRVQATTNIESANGWLSWFNFGKTEMEINYQVLVPKDIYLDLTNKYGDIYMESTDRDLKIELAYGNIRLGDVNANLKMDMSYSEGNISQIKDGDITLKYSDLEMEDGQNVTMNNRYVDLKTGSIQKLNLESAYSNLKSVSIGQFEYNGKYDDVVLDRAGSVHAETAYTDIVIDEVEKGGDFDMRYGDLQLKQIHRGFSNININTSYTGVEIELTSDASFSIDAETNYCDISHPELKIMEDSQRELSATLVGSRGVGGGEIKARMSYGELNIETADKNSPAKP